MQPTISNFSRVYYTQYTLLSVEPGVAQLVHRYTMASNSTDDMQVLPAKKMNDNKLGYVDDGVTLDNFMTLKRK